MIQAIIFDFDGVLVDSNKIRRNTYFDIFPENGKRDEIVEEALKASKTKTRWGLIEDILIRLKENNLIDYNDLEQATKEYVDRYSRITEEKVSQAPEIKGSEESLRRLSEKYPLFIVSGTTQESLDIVINNRNLNSYFKQVLGTKQGQRSKIDLIDSILQRFSLDPKQIVYVGDGKEDLEVAKHYEMDFVGVINEKNGFEDRIDIMYKIRDLENLNELVSEINTKIS